MRARSNIIADVIILELNFLDVNKILSFGFPSALKHLL